MIASETFFRRAVLAAAVRSPGSSFCAEASASQGTFAMQSRRMHTSTQGERNGFTKSGKHSTDRGALDPDSRAGLPLYELARLGDGLQA